MRIAILNPSPSSPSRFATGTRAPSKTSSPVVEPAMPIFGSSRDTSKPGVPASMTNAVIPSCPARGSVFANTVYTLATPAFVMNRFSPSIT